MKIDGKQIASEIKVKLEKQVFSLRKKKIIPHLAVILVGNDPSSQAYIRQKQKTADEIGTKMTVNRIEYPGSDKVTSKVAECLPAGRQGLPSRWRNLNKNKLIALVDKLNRDTSVHGIIIQRPVPIDINKEDLDNLVIPRKDVDGFYPLSPFTPPIAMAILKILENVFKNNSPGRWPERTPSRWRDLDEALLHWLKKQNILIIGRGETGGKPIANTFEKMGIPFTVAHSKTTNLKELCLKSDIIISCVGKPNVVRHHMITNESVIIGVGLHPENGKLDTDYDQEEIAKKAAYWTPVPGGVGPVNVACLFENLLQATSRSLK